MRLLLPDVLAATGSALDTVGGDLLNVHVTYGRDVLAPLAGGDGWTGGGQPAAVAKVRAIQSDIGDAGELIRAGGTIAGRWAGGLAEAQTRLWQLERIAADGGLRIEDDGTVVTDEAVALAAAKVDDDLRLAIATRVGALIATATDVDDRCAADLRPPVWSHAHDKQGQGADDFVIDARDRERNQAEQIGRETRKAASRFDNVDVIGHDQEGGYRPRRLSPRYRPRRLRRRQWR